MRALNIQPIGADFSLKSTIYNALKDAIMKAKPALLEPIVDIEVIVPSK